MAFAAAKAVRVAYEPLEPVLSIQEALANKHYTFHEQIMERGDPDGAIEAAVNRVSGRVSCGGQDHFYLEGQVALALPGEDNDMLVYSSTQHPSEVQHGVAHVLGIASNQVTVEVRRMGGGFGGKESQPTIIAAAAALAAHNRSARKISYASG